MVALFSGVQYCRRPEMYKEADGQPDIHHDQGFSNKFPFNHTAHCHFHNNIYVPLNHTACCHSCNMFPFSHTACSCFFKEFPLITQHSVVPVIRSI